MKFIDKNKGNSIEVIVHEDATLDEVLEMFQGFLRACGYVIPYDEAIEKVKTDEL